MPRTRRDLLKLGGGIVFTTAIAGCTDDGGEAGEGEEEPPEEEEPAGGEEGDDHDDHDEEDDHDHDDEELEDAGFAEFELIDQETDEVSAYVHGDHWDGGLPQILVGESVSLGAYIEDEDGEEIPLGKDGYELNAEIAEGAQEGIVEIEAHGDHVDLHGEDLGLTELVFQLWHDDHADYESPPIDAEVVEEIDEDHGDENDHGHGDDDDHDDDHGHDDDDHGHDDEDDDHGHDDDDHDHDD